MKRYAELVLIILFLSTYSACSRVGNSTFIPTFTSVVIDWKTPANPPRPQETPTPPDPSAPLWIANPQDRTILRVDPLTNTITAVVEIEGRPDAVAAGEGAVWVLDRRLNKVFRVDPATNQVTASVVLPPGTASTIAVGDGSVWVGMTGRIDINAQSPGAEEDVLPPGFIVRIDPKRTAVLEQFAAQPVSQILVNGSALWVLSTSAIDTPLQVIDVASRQGMVVPFQNGPEWLPVDALAVDADNLWLYSAAYGKIFHASPGGQISSAVSLEERPPVGLPGLLVDSTGLWAITTWGTVLHIDPASNHILGKIELNAPLTSLLASPGAIWVLSQQTATLFRIDPASQQVTAQIETGSLLLPTVVPTPTPRMVLWKPCPDAPTSRLKVGDTAYVTKDPPLPNRVRKEPNHDAELLGAIGPGGGMDIIDGPSCANNWVWWKVKNADLEGWTPEGDFETYWLIPIYK